MGLIRLKTRTKVPLNFKKEWKAILILLVGIVLSVVATFFTKEYVHKSIIQDFEFSCDEIEIKINERLKAHAQLLRSGKAFYAASDTVTRDEWKNFNKNKKIDQYLPGIMGVGYSLIIPKNKLNKHIQSIRNNGFPTYTILPEGNREIYTSIIYIEPFTGRNLRAFGYDMYTDPVRRKAMELSRDLNVAMLSGKVMLVQETNQDIQAGALMYIPIYKNGMPLNTLEERRNAITGWVFSPYRMNDLMNGILGVWNQEGKRKVNLKIYDGDQISPKTLLYDNMDDEITPDEKKAKLIKIDPIEFNGKKWTVVFTGENKNLSYIHIGILIVFISGIAISILLFVLLLALIKSKRREKEIVELNNKLEKLNTDKDRFISILAHDLKSPFNAMIGFSDLLVKNIRNYDIDKIEKQIVIINNSVKQIFKLLEDILVWAKTQAGKIPFELTEINFTFLCNEVVENMNLSVINKNITVQCFLLDEISLFADYNMLRTILRNLLSNAIKFTYPGGKIEIQIEQKVSDFLISVSDNGVGIEPEIVNNIFNFVQLHSSAGTANEKGSGFGLIICKEFVECHGGKIWVESTIGKGSCFKFTIPQIHLRK